ncbi:outer membrane protein assembly factor BamE [Pseudooceanicola sp.]|uniref:outer membrane protein assembly factor BamE n=1 Tax=Pseudooceanicola sp. TaxID=1914328 RepID=UPI002604E8C7|nr:outer membrane protein assembly factor BamE [Pseudooceanicola sp.]MDF1854744.1 outer membrane protein assembly factor BamE [Pseudooceanicola sp.]
MTNAIRTAALGACLALTLACTPIYRDHGYVPIDEELAQIVVGKDNRQSVLEKIGEPATGGLLEDSGYYYIHSRMRTIGPRRPEVIDRQVVAISFNQRGLVSNVERFGLKDGNVVPLSRRVTSSSAANKGFLRQLLGNLGRFSASDMLGG